jgi:cephalosporin-C deacetylase-like acetyl esterase
MTDAFSEFILAQAKALRQGDEPPETRGEWERRRATLLPNMFSAMGPTPDKPCPLEPKVVGVIKRASYHIERLVFQSRPDVWVTANLYKPAEVKEKLPAILVVHGHWRGARRDPVVQARCLGLAQLGFVVLAVDAFGAGERFTQPALGTYHGALYGSTLWPAGHTLLGLQVYDNRRAVDYLATRDEVDEKRIGITGASGGGNQSMYAGALDSRIQAVVPVCSVGNFQAYLKAACCVCEVLPGALRFTEEGDVLGLVAPRALLVINASRDAYQFSPKQAEVSVDRAKRVYGLYAVRDKIQHVVFESGHDYSKPMREAMYGWMAKWLKNQGDGSPITEPEIKPESSDDLACFGEGERPETFTLLPQYAAREAASLVNRANQLAPKHAEDWESTAAFARGELRKLLGDIPKSTRPVVRLDKTIPGDEVVTTNGRINGESDLFINFSLLERPKRPEIQPVALALHLDGRMKAMQHPVTVELVKKGWLVATADLRAMGSQRPEGDIVRTAPDHNSTEHALWIGRPLLGQWLFDIQQMLDWLSQQPNRDPKRYALVGLDQAGTLALTASALLPERITSVLAWNSLSSFVTDRSYADGTRMSLLAPGILKVGDIPHLAALTAPKRLIIANCVHPNGQRLGERQARAAMSFTAVVYKALKSPERLSVFGDARAEDMPALL